MSNINVLIRDVYTILSEQCTTYLKPPYHLITFLTNKHLWNVHFHMCNHTFLISHLHMWSWNIHLWKQETWGQLVVHVKPYVHLYSNVQFHVWKSNLRFYMWKNVQMSPAVSWFQHVDIFHLHLVTFVSLEEVFSYVVSYYHTLLWHVDTCYHMNFT